MSAWLFSYISKMNNGARTQWFLGQVCILNLLKKLTSSFIVTPVRPLNNDFQIEMMCNPKRTGSLKFRKFPHQIISVVVRRKVRWEIS